MAIRKFVLAQRGEPFDLPTLARRHFGADAKVRKGDDGRMRVCMSTLPNMSRMAGFLAEVRRLGASANWDAPHQEFVIHGD